MSKLSAKVLAALFALALTAASSAAAEADGSSGDRPAANPYWCC